MPRVPSLDTFQTGLSTAPRGRFSAPGGPSADGIAAEQGGRLGQAVGQAGQALGRIAQDIQAKADEVRVIDAVTRAKERLFDLQYGETGFTKAKGVEALQRPSGKLLADEYEEQFGTTIGEIEQGLGNDAQRMAFRRQAEQMRLSLRGDTMRHTAQEFKTYQSATYDAAASAAKRQISLSYADLSDDGRVAEGVRTVTAAVKEKARLLGMPQTWADEQVINEVSGAHRLAIKTALDNGDVEIAGNYLRKHQGGMTADDILAVRGVLDKEMRTRVAAQVASGVVAELTPRLQPTDFDRLVGITMQTESGGRRYGPDGKTLLTSPKGARGEMQVMPGTQRDPGFGVKPAQDDSPEELARVGRDYLRAMLKRYDGDPAKAWAAYNAGPGALDEALLRANASPTPGASWLTFMPNETQAYVAKNLKLLEGGFGAPPAPTLLDVQTAVRNRLGPNADPMVVQAATQAATQQWEVTQKSMREREDQMVAEAQRMLLANGGRYDDLPASVRAALPPGKADDLMGFASRIAKGENVPTDWGLYYRLASDPTLLAQTNLAALRSRLAPAEFKQLTDRQVNLSKENDGTRLMNARQIMDGMLRENGIDPTPKDNDKRGAEKVGQMLSTYQARIDAREARQGKKLTDAELREEAAALFQPVKTRGMLGFTTETPAGLVDAETEVRVPDAERKQIEAALRRAGRAVTNEAVEALYRARNQLPQRATNG